MLFAFSDKPHVASLPSVSMTDVVSVLFTILTILVQLSALLRRGKRDSPSVC